MGLGVQKKQVLITKMTSTSASRRRRRLSTTTTVEYQVTMDPDVTAPSSIETKISSGDVSATTIVSKAQASSDANLPAAFQALTSDDIAPSTTSTSTTFVADASGGDDDDDDDDLALIVGV